MKLLSPPMATSKDYLSHTIVVIKPWVEEIEEDDQGGSPQLSCCIIIRSIINSSEDSCSHHQAEKSDHDP